MGEPNSGVGLFELRRYCESGGGVLAIASGETMLSFAAGRSPIAHPLAGGFPGCLVSLEFVV
jgi:hypothetical protein